MHYLYDTDVLIDHLRLRKSIQPKKLYKQAISVITYGELIYGARKSHNARHKVDQVQDFVYSSKLHVLPVDTQVINIFCTHKVTLEQAGKKVDDFDLLIAATAIFHSLQLVTNNIRHFTRIEHLIIAR